MLTQIVRPAVRRQEIGEITQMLHLRRLLLVEPAGEGKRAVGLQKARNQRCRDIAATRHGGDVVDGIEHLRFVVPGKRSQRLQTPRQNDAERMPPPDNASPMRLLSGVVRIVPRLAAFTASSGARSASARRTAYRHAAAPLRDSGRQTGARPRNAAVLDGAAAEIDDVALPAKDFDEVERHRRPPKVARHLKRI